MPVSCVHTTEYTEWQRPLSGVHSILMENMSMLVRFGGARPPLFTIVTFMYKVAVYTPAERADPYSVVHTSLVYTREST
jgi:hypothetical protein